MDICIDEDINVEESAAANDAQELQKTKKNAF